MRLSHPIMFKLIRTCKRTSYRGGEHPKLKIPPHSKLCAKLIVCVNCICRRRMVSMIPSTSSRLYLRVARRNLSTRALQPPISRSLPVYNSRTTQLCQPLLQQPQSLTRILPFHSTSKRNILPAEPRRLSPVPLDEYNTNSCTEVIQGTGQ